MSHRSPFNSVPDCGPSNHKKLNVTAAPGWSVALFDVALGFSSSVREKRITKDQIGPKSILTLDTNRYISPVLGCLTKF